MEALIVLAALACPIGMLVMMGGMMWMGHRAGSAKHDTPESPETDVRQATHA
jgi:uncharacterized iron-regulated membrane protein